MFFLILSQSCSNDKVNNCLTEENTNVVSDSDESISEEKTTNNANGGTDVCYYHKLDFHFFNQPLIDYVGKEAFYSWMEKTEKIKSEDGCRYPECQLYNCIRYFSIPKEIIVELYNSSYQDICVDLLYGEDEEAVDLYYRLPIDEGRREAQEKFEQFYYMKGNFVLKYWDRFSEIPGWGNNTHIFEYSMV